MSKLCIKIGVLKCLKITAVMLLYTRGLKMTYIRLPVNKSKEKKEILLTRLPNHFTWSQMSKEAFTNYVPNVCPFLTTYLGGYIYSRDIYSRLYSKCLFTRRPVPSTDQALQNFMNIDGMTLKTFFWFLRRYAGPQKLEHKVDHKYFTV